MGAGRVARNVEPIRVSAEARRVLVNPAYRPADLIGHSHQVAVHLGSIIEVHRNKMRAGIDETLGHVGRTPCITTTPSTAMEENINWRVGLFGCIDLHFLDLAGSVGDPTWLAETSY